MNEQELRLEVLRLTMETGSAAVIALFIWAISQAR